MLTLGPIEPLVVALLLGVSSGPEGLIIGSIGYSLVTFILAKLGLNPYIQDKIERELKDGNNLVLSNLRPLSRLFFVVFMISGIIMIIKDNYF